MENPYLNKQSKILLARVSGKLLQRIGKVRVVEELSESEIIRDALRKYVDDKINRAERPKTNTYYE